MENYGLIFRDSSDKTLRVAVFNQDRNSFQEVYDVNEEINPDFSDLDFETICFSEITEMSNPEAYEFKFLFDFEFDTGEENAISSRKFIIECYDEKNPNLIAEVFNFCIDASKDETISEVFIPYNR